jgi:hypothetical protein
VSKVRKEANMRRTGFTVLALATVSGCVVSLTGYQHHRREVAQVSQDVTSVDLDVSAGDVTVAVDPAAASTSIARTRRWNVSEPCVTSSYTDGAVALSDSCTGGACAVDYDITLPAPAAITLGGGSGDVTISGVADALALTLGSGDITLTDDDGDVVASTGSGDMELTRVGGTIDLSTGSGDIRGSDLTATTTAATTGSGDVALAFDTTPARVEIVTGSGDASLVVPAGTYRIETHSSSGDVTVTGLTDGDGPLLSVDVESGDISISGE